MRIGISRTQQNISWKNEDNHTLTLVPLSLISSVIISPVAIVSPLVVIPSLLVPLVVLVPLMPLVAMVTLVVVLVTARGYLVGLVIPMILVLIVRSRARLWTGKKKMSLSALK